ncbi:MAG TPA: asparagine synthase-related protein [Polyangia bacterium]|nr:asparagine synthase-related protein [Polyangia bacterium]
MVIDRPARPRLATRIDWSRAGRRPALDLPEGWCRRIAWDDGEALLSVIAPAPRDCNDWTGRIDHVGIVADARIDNAAELAVALGVERADSPRLLLHCYLTWGVSFASRLVGDFAIVIWDSRRKELIACRDPFGIKPLVAREGRNELWLGSGVDQALRADNALPPVSERSIVEHLLRTYRSLEGSFFEGIEFLLPGTVTVFRAARIDRTRYWHPPRHGTSGKGTKEELQVEVARLFKQAVRRRLPPEGCAVIQISGGLDSSAIAVTAGMLARSGYVDPKRLSGASGRHPGQPCDEGQFIAAVQDVVPFSIEMWNANDARAIELSPRIVDRPGARAPLIGGSNGDLAIALKNDAAVVLSGIGGDELMTPAGIIRDAIADGAYRRAIDDLVFFAGATNKSRIAKAWYLIRDAAPDSLQDAWSFWRASAPEWLASDLHRLAREILVPEHHRATSFETHVQEKKWSRLVSASLIRPIESLQRNAIDWGVEYRFPYLDLDLVNFVLSLPYYAWPRPRPAARLHREALRAVLPTEIANRWGKAEFTPTLRASLTRSTEVVEFLLQQPTWRSARFVNRISVGYLWNRMTHTDGVPGRLPRDLWAIFTLEAWMSNLSRYHPGH